MNPPEPLESSALYRAAYPPVMLALRMLFKAMAPRWRITGRGHIPQRGAFILAPNHISDADPPFVGVSVLRPLWFMAKEELFNIKVIGPWISFCLRIYRLRWSKFLLRSRRTGLPRGAEAGLTRPDVYESPFP